MQGLTESFVTGSQQWRPLYDSPEPHKMQLPHGLHLLPAFKKLLILRCIRWAGKPSNNHPPPLTHATAACLRALLAEAGTSAARPCLSSVWHWCSLLSWSGISFQPTVALIVSARLHVVAQGLLSYSQCSCIPRTLLSRQA